MGQDLVKGEISPKESEIQCDNKNLEADCVACCGEQDAARNDRKRVCLVSHSGFSYLCVDAHEIG